ncbi:MAG: NAD kinase [Crocinitomicaceae bacterium]|nr:NAD kinase [Crocinitomicaceae bacterium]
MNVALYSRKVSKTNLPYVVELIKHCQQLGWKLIFEQELKKQLIKAINLSDKSAEFSSHKDFKGGIDLTISLGGDGTFIQAVSYVRDSKVPIIGINTGRLGFLSNVAKESMDEALEMLQKKQFELQNRSLLCVETEKNHFGDANFALNEVAVSRKDSSTMLTVHTELNNQYMNSYWGDGLIISTPTGSTAYNLACGGPIIDPQCQLHVVTPIAPHNLNVRPIVIPDDKIIKLSVEGRSRNYLLSLDGHSVNIKQHEEIIVRKANFGINVVKLLENEFLDTIRNKLLWGIDRRNK